MVYDDPTPNMYKTISTVFKNGHPLGISPIVSVHSYEMLNSNPWIRILRDQATIICF